MKLYSINTGHFKLDGGAMFGVVPKSIWNKMNPADERNMCSWAMRCMLLEEGNRLILIDTGIGSKQDDRFLSFYCLHGEDTLDKSLARHGFHRNDITDVFLTHLHFDHCGGAIEWDNSKASFRPAFPNAVFWSNALHWQAAVNPNPREKASFLKDNILPIKETGQLQFVRGTEEWMPGWYNYFVHGHTDAMMIPRIRYKNTEVLFMADLIPSSHHIKIPYLMGYDIRPLDTMQEKQEVLGYASANQTVLFFEHDPQIECAFVTESDKGILLESTFRLDEI